VESIPSPNSQKKNLKMLTKSMIPQLENASLDGNGPAGVRNWDGQSQKRAVAQYDWRLLVE
jgi:hypothetical protein